MMTTMLSDSIHLPGSLPSTVKKRYLTIFITGNPGLIEYYRAFLTYLYSLCNSVSAKSQDVAYDFYGASIPGFDFSISALERWKKLGLDHTPPFSLDEVIDAVENDLWRVVKQTQHEGEELGVIVIGHSLGSFITLELIQRHRRRLESGQNEVRIVGGICLFPTVVDIAESERGKVLTVSLSLPTKFAMRG
jgi:pimeloyl-ACP methyl ester carboxylesterase